MTHYQIALVQWTWKQVTPIADTAAKLFFGRLFELDPSVKPMFKGEPVEQGRKLMKAIDAAVNGLQHLDRLVPVLRGLGARHVGYGVRDEHYATGGEALLWTLKQGLGGAFTHEVHDAWAAAYELLSGVMGQGAAQARESAVHSRIAANG